MTNRGCQILRLSIPYLHPVEKQDPASSLRYRRKQARQSPGGGVLDAGPFRRAFYDAVEMKIREYAKVGEEKGEGLRKMNLLDASIEVSLTPDYSTIAFAASGGVLNPKRE